MVVATQGAGSFQVFSRAHQLRDLADVSDVVHRPFVLIFDTFKNEVLRFQALTAVDFM
jgi:hypothetical protein